MVRKMQKDASIFRRVATEERPLQRVPEQEGVRKGNKGAALVGLGMLFFLIAYLAWQYEKCYQYAQIGGISSAR